MAWCEHASKKARAASKADVPFGSFFARFFFSGLPSVAFASFGSLRFLGLAGFSAGVPPPASPSPPSSPSSLSLLDSLPDGPLAALKSASSSESSSSPPPPPGMPMPSSSLSLRPKPAARSRCGAARLATGSFFAVRKAMRLSYSERAMLVKR
jgi:hypothetical protein